MYRFLKSLIKEVDPPLAERREDHSAVPDLLNNMPIFIRSIAVFFYAFYVVLTLVLPLNRPNLVQSFYESVESKLSPASLKLCTMYFYTYKTRRGMFNPGIYTNLF